MAQLITVRLNKGDSPNLGFRLQGGKDFGTPLVIQKVNGGSPAERAGLVAGDAVIKINTTDVFNLRHKDAQDVIVRAGPAFEMTLQRGGSTWKPTVTPVASYSKPTPAANNISPVTKTSLAASNQNNIGSIGTGHNVSAKPFAAVNGTSNGPRLANKQYNSPIGLYSETAIAETLSAQAEVLSTGALGVNFKKNEKNYDSTNSAVYRMLQEAESEPRDSEQEQESYSGAVSPSVGIGGLRHVTAPETKPTPPTPQLPPGQNICADCERLIVGVFVRIKDKNLHVECFKCSTCGTSLKNVGYYNINNKLYCDVHAKLAARSNPPAPNLVPITVPPGGKVPSSAISSALASHSLPAAAPLSPNTVATPFQQELTLNGDNVTKLLRNLSLAADKKKTENFVSEVTIEVSEQNKCNNQNDVVSLTTNTLLPVPTYTKYITNACSNLSGPRPFSSVSAPLSPPVSNQSILPKTSPLSPVKPAAPPPSFNSPVPPSAQAPEGRSIESIVWPPVQDQSEFPTASPLYFPPPSQVQVTKLNKSIDNSESEIDQIEYAAYQEPKLSICSAEVTGLMERRKSASECIEIISETIDNQKLVESIVKDRPKSPPPIDADIVVEAKQSASQVECKKCEQTVVCELKRPTQFSPNTLERQHVTSPANKVENVVPKGWESPMVVALTVASDIPIRDISIKCSNRPNTENTFSQIPTKRSSSALASALAIAPVEPFTPIQPTTSEPVPLPEETVPYMPPEHQIVIEPKETKPEQPDSEFVSALKVAPERPFTPAGGAPVKKKKQPEDKYLQDLPKPQEKLTMRDALTTASDRPYSPLAVEMVGYKEEVKEEKVIEKQTKIEHPPLHKPKKVTILPTSFQPVTETNTKPPTSFPPVSQELFSAYESKSNYSEIKSEISSQIIEQSCSQSISETSEHGESKKIMEKTAVTKETCDEKINEGYSLVNDREIIEKQAEDTIYKRPLPLASALHKPGALPQYQVNFSETVEASLKMMDKLEAQATSAIEAKRCLIPNPVLELKHKPNPAKVKPSLPVIEVISEEAVKRPIITVKSDQVEMISQEAAFQPVVEDRPSSTFSTRPRSLTPSMINKPPPTIPYYQANLVAQHYAAASTNLLDPKSPAISRSPSPCPERSSSPFKTPSSTLRPKSPAAGPPENPLKSPYPLQTVEDAKVEEAKQSLLKFIPQYKEKMDFMEKTQIRDQLYSSESAYAAKLESDLNKKRRTNSICELTRNNISSQDMHLTQTALHQAETNKSCMEMEQAGLTTSIKQLSDLEHSEEFNKMEMQSVEKSADGLIQVQRKKTVSEEFEHTHKEKTIEIEKKTSETKKYPFQKVNVPIKDEQGIIGLHVTNPQPIASPFITKQKCQSSCASQSQQQCQKSQQLLVTQPQSQQSFVIQAQTQQSSVPQHPQQSYVPQQQQQPQQSFVPQQQPQQPFVPQQQPQQSFLPKASTVPQSQRIPPRSILPSPSNPVPQAVPTPKASAPKAIPASTQSVIRPNVSPPNAGATGGRQAGAVGVAPKRGRGVLNTAAIGGARVPLCGQCHSYVRGPFITALGKIWCPEHFICATPSCKRPLQDMGFVEEKGQLYCEYCFEQYLAPPCSKCSAKIKGDCLKAIGKNFHPECFNCGYCGKLFGNNPFFLEDGLPYCEADWNELFTTKCFACGFPVEAGDRWVEALNNNYHSQCFNCTMCKKNLEGQSFFAKGGRPFCKNHAR